MKTVYISDTPNLVGKEVELRGWVNTIRNHKKIVFIDLRDSTGVVQVVGDSTFASLSPESVVSIKGLIKKRLTKLINTKIKTGNIEVEAKEFTVLALAKELPFDMSKEKLDVSLPILLDYRSLTLRHQSIRSIFKVQETIVQTFRKTMKDHGFTEIQTPTIVATATEGGAEVFPVSYFQYKAFMAQSPQFYKQIMVSIFEKVFTVAHAYRAEPSVTTRHLTEYVGLDVEMGFIDSWTELMDMAENMLKSIFEAVKMNHADVLTAHGVEIPAIEKNIPRIKLVEAKEIIFKRTGRDIRKEPDLDPEGERELSKWAAETQGSDLVFVSHYPTKKRPMYTHPDPKNPEETLSFDLIGKGQEWITGGQRINNYDDLVANIKKWGQNPDNFEIPYLQAFKFGMPPEGGFCLGLERITMNILGLSNIREASLFPRDMERVDVKLAIGMHPKQKQNINVFNSIISLLDNAKIKYKILEHAPAFTSEEASKIRHTTLSQGAKAMVMFAEDKPIMLVLPADKKIDLKLFKANHELKNLRMATPEEVEKITGVKIGAVPPFGNVFNIPLYMDKSQGNNEDVVFNAGLHTKSIIMKCSDFVKMTNPQVEIFSK